ncbi:MAG TPA: winged helix-turn-helix domain-containing protein [Solirubrobacteraceae bacterium]|nr:winged helix-turn-helix domain-containing protein [Solirubrobacteraceae bacterium]
MSKAVQDIDDPRLVKALAHPIRVRILGILEHRTATPKELAAELGLPLENTSYHVRTLKKFGFIKLERKRQVRGAVEHHYRAVARPRVTAKAWEQMPESLKQAMNAANISQLSELVNRGVAQGKFSRPESQLQRMPYTLDDEGFREASAVLSEALERISEVEKRAKERVQRGESDPVQVVTAVMLFDRPDPGPLPSAEPVGEAEDEARHEARSPAPAPGG